LRAEGQLSGRWVEELVAACEQALEESGRVALDLTGVTFVDANGSAALRALRRKAGVTVVRASAYVAEILREAAR
jgi:ABC-type transporter Mla MlaB component